MSVIQISGYRVSWTETRVTVSDDTLLAGGGTLLPGSMFQTMLSNIQKLHDNGAKQLKGMDLAQPAANAESGSVSETPKSLFDYWANLTDLDPRFLTTDGCYKASSRYMTMMEDYEDWKRKQADSTLPASQGSEEDDLAWLREKFSGELDAFEVIDAIESLYSMGRIDRAERNDIYGITVSVIRVTDINVLTKCVQLPAHYDPYRADGFERAPLMDFHTLDDILEWLKSCRAQPLSVRELQWRAAAVETDLICRIAAEEGLPVERADTPCAEEVAC